MCRWIRLCGPPGRSIARPCETSRRFFPTRRTSYGLSPRCRSPADRLPSLSQRAALEHGVGVESDDNGAGVVLPHAAVEVASGGLLQPLVVGPPGGGCGEIAGKVVAQLAGVLLVDGTVGYDGQDNL